MNMKNNLFRKFIAMLLVSRMVLGGVPVTALSDGVETPPVEQTVPQGVLNA